MACTIISPNSRLYSPRISSPNAFRCASGSALLLSAAPSCSSPSAASSSASGSSAGLSISSTWAAAASRPLPWAGADAAFSAAAGAAPSAAPAPAPSPPPSANSCNFMAGSSISSAPPSVTINSTLSGYASASARRPSSTKSNQLATIKAFGPDFGRACTTKVSPCCTQLVRSLPLLAAASTLFASVCASTETAAHTMSCPAGA